MIIIKNTYKNIKIDLLNLKIFYFIKFKDVLFIFKKI